MSKTTAAERSAARTALGNADLTTESIEDCVARYRGMKDGLLRKRLRGLEARFADGGGRGVELADEIDKLRVALAVRGVRKGGRT